MRANALLLTPIVCFVGACGSPGTALAQTEPYRSPAGPYRSAPGGAGPYRAAPGVPRSYWYPSGTSDWGDSGYPPSIPHDYPGPALRGGGGG